ncbi:MAG: STAS domain-containing protein [Chitinivibrionales bacterium]|nr:STAS domain-containing protein [Chitinivibrionales bacterium]
MELTPDYALYKFNENIYIGNADDLWEKIEPLFNDAGKTTIVFDMENVRICDSYGVRLLLNCQRKAERSGKKMVLLKPDHLVRDMFKSIRLDTVFSIADELP